uniref:UspA domain-containing protein n=2 Tax=Aegilops tauschii subsp. strangulata TaxID=200361 RepID=A0A453RCZ3_AEGTS
AGHILDETEHTKPSSSLRLRCSVSFPSSILHHELAGTAVLSGRPTGQEDRGMAEAVRDDHRGAVGVAVDDGTGLRPSTNGDSTWEIEELEPDDRTAGPPPPPPPGAAATSDADDVYVAVGKGGSSMAALSWALRQLAKPRSFVYLVHVFPVVATIPTPCNQATLFPFTTF